MTIADEMTPPGPLNPDAQRTIFSRLVGLVGMRATWVLADQGIVSLGNFITGIYLTRGLGQEEAGKYGVLLNTILYLNSLQNAVVIYPLLIKGATGDRNRLGQLATSAIFLTIGLLPILGAAMLGAAFTVHDPYIAVSAILALVLWQLQETTRRALTSDLRFADVVWGDAVSYLGQAILVMVMASTHTLTLNNTFLVMAATSAAAIFVQSWQIGVKPVRFSDLRLVAKEFWLLGRWMVLVNASSVITMLGYDYTLLWRHGERSNAVFLAIAMPFKLANPIMSSMAGLITPAVARAAKNHGIGSATRIGLRYVGLGAALLAPYFLLLFIFATPILSWLAHGGKNYAEYAYLMRLFMVNYTMVYFSNVVSSWVAGLGRSKLNFYSQALSVVATLVIGIPLTYLYGVDGLVIGGLCSATVCTLAVCVLAVRVSKETNAVFHSPDSV